jgi:hypothetical protein
VSKLRIDHYLAAIEDQGAEAASRAEMEYLAQAYSTPGSVKKALSAYRNALRAIDAEHVALKYMRQSKADSTELKRDYAATVSTRQRNVRVISDVDGYLIYAESLLAATSYIDRLLALAALTGRRTSELLCSAQLEAAGDYAAVFTGQLKAKGRETEPYIIPLLTDYTTIADALERLQAGQRDLWGNPEKAGNRTHKAISTRIKALRFAHFLGDGVIGRDLRRAYGAIAFAVSGLEGTITQQKYVSDVLGHGFDDNVTGGSYMDFVVIE